MVIDRLTMGSINDLLNRDTYSNVLQIVVDDLIVFAFAGKDG